MSSRYRSGDKLCKLLSCISQWKHFKVLAMKNVEYLDYSRVLFPMMLPELTHLESLKLGVFIMSDIVTLIGTHLKKLEFLVLHNGFYNISSLQSLSNLPNLKFLWILHDVDIFGGKDFRKLDYCQSIYTCFSYPAQDKEGYIKRL